MTAYGGRILGPIAKLFGIIINAIYNFFETTVGIENVNIAFIIVIFTIVIYTLLLPFTYQQQKFTVLQRKISPELQVINNKYKGKKDQASMLKRQEETQALYDKYGISMSGNCIQLFIQMPILYALYGVFRNLPAYIGSVRNIFDELVVQIQNTAGYEKKMQSLYESISGRGLSKIDFLDKTASIKDLGNNIIDVVYVLSEDGWRTLEETFPTLADTISVTHNNLKEINYLFILNISDNPLNIVKSAFLSKQYLLIFAALLIPLFSYLSQSLNLKIAQANSPSNNSTDPMAQQMQVMNKIMPLISLFFVFSVPIGLGIYWIAGAVYRSVSMLILNKHFEKMNIETIIEKNKEKAAKKRAKRQARNESITLAATMNTKKTTMAERANIGNSDTGLDNNEVKSYKSDSLTGKANLVAEFNRKNNKK